MSTQKRIDIRFETREVLVIKTGGGLAWCARCDRKVRIVHLVGADL
ncbi:MAG TPA: hypothetical protein VLD57_02925 [Blastocatellia bacterium]|nr:hypothetical protein [Blastocatellia bacterium]